MTYDHGARLYRCSMNSDDTSSGLARAWRQQHRTAMVATDLPAAAMAGRAHWQETMRLLLASEFSGPFQTWPGPVRPRPRTEGDRMQPTRL